MGLEPEARLVIRPEIEVRELPLTPIDFFLFSRVEAITGTQAPTVADVIAASGQPRASAEQALAKLIELGVLLVEQGERAIVRPSAAASPSPSAADDAARRKTALDRKRALLTAQLRMAQDANPRVQGRERVTGAAVAKPAVAGSVVAKPAGPEPAVEEEPSLPTPHAGVIAGSGQVAGSSKVAPRSILEEVEPVPLDDGRLVPQLAVPLDRQRRLLALRDRLRQVGHFELLGLNPTDDVKVIRRAYHLVSREFHPDSYFGKELGPYRAVLDDLFRRARSSYEFLLDGSRRAMLVASHEAQAQERGGPVTREAAQAKPAGQTRSQRAPISAERREQAAQHAQRARREQQIGRHGTASTLFRLAHEQDPTHPDYDREWQASLATARRHRAELSSTRGAEALAAGRIHEAARHHGEAATADPSLRNLSEAAAVLSEVDPEQALSFATAALEALRHAQASGLPVDEQTIAKVHQASARAHQASARALLAAGQAGAARDQAERANQLAPSDQTRALLNSIKLT